MLQRIQIWFAFLGGAGAWILHFMGGYAISEGFCRSDFASASLLGPSVMHWCLALLTLLALVITFGALWMARRQHLASLARVSRRHGDVLLFMSRSSMISNSLFLLFILAESIPIVILGGTCA